MKKTSIRLPIYLPERFIAGAKKLRDRVRPTHPINLLGDRDIEWSFIAANIPDGEGRALDFGPGGSPLGLIAAMRGFEVTTLDLNPIHPPYRHPRLSHRQGDILLTEDIQEGSFSLVLNCSAIEHVGIPGRYGVSVGMEDGDLAAMKKMRSLMSPGGTMLLSIPVGRDAVFAPVCRVYGERRLPRLIDGFVVQEERYWMKDSDNRWALCGSEDALRYDAWAGSGDPLRIRYAIGCFVLNKS